MRKRQVFCWSRGGAGRNSETARVRDRDHEVSWPRPGKTSLEYYIPACHSEQYVSHSYAHGRTQGEGEGLLRHPNCSKEISITSLCNVPGCEVSKGVPVIQINTCKIEKLSQEMQNLYWLFTSRPQSWVII